MKPRELSVFEALPDPIIAYRAHRPGETDWLSLTLSDYKAAQFARLRGVDHIVEYSIPKEAALCLFLRRGEFEVLTLHRERATKRREIAVIYEDEGGVSIAGGAI